ncbi:uncharacterized protein LOC121386856 [Gigantopelta aegis]|uniref:uncharacterized protein LOC121386856 n=1 Tax=Gigantopelta aegis TaxID=1735272 RepID=UPI001B889CD8|nr:uncharacterized protein LOC121386856 [Gigantopelta aegis]
MQDHSFWVNMSRSLHVTISKDAAAHGDDTFEDEMESDKKTNPKWGGAVLKALMAETNVDDKVIQILQLVFPAWALYLQKAVKAHLPGGEHDNPSEEKRAKTTSVPKYNKFSEAFFRILHNLTTQRPNASILANEAYIVFSLNRTLQWICDKMLQERNKLVKRARKLSRRLQQRFKMRKEEIRRKRIEAMNRAREVIARNRQRQLKEKEQLTNDIVFYGLWQSEEEVHTNAKSFKTKKEWQKAFAAQLKFRKFVLKQEHEDKTVFNLSKDRKDYSHIHRYKRILSS